MLSQYSWQQLATICSWLLLNVLFKISNTSASKHMQPFASVTSDPWPVGDDGLHGWSGGHWDQVRVLVRLILTGVLDELALLLFILPIFLLLLRWQGLADAIYLVAIVTCDTAELLWLVRTLQASINKVSLRFKVYSPIVISKLIVLSPIFLSTMVASRKDPNKKNSSIFPVALWRGDERDVEEKVDHFIAAECIRFIVCVCRSFFLLFTIHTRVLSLNYWAI